MTATAERAIPEIEASLEAGVLRPLDLITVDLVRPAPLPHQAENWLMTPGSIGLVRHVPLQSALSQLEAKSTTDVPLLRSSTPTIHPLYFTTRRSPAPSLAVIKVGSFQVVTKEEDGRSRKGRRVLFDYRQSSWSLSFTDEHFSIPDPKLPGPPAFLCLSVGDYWEKKNLHYKLVAGIIPIEPSRSE